MQRRKAMEYLVTAFRSRTDTVRFYEFLRRNGINSQIINTPKQAGVGCGLSVKTATGALESIKKAIRFTALSSFAGIFLVKKAYGNVIVKSI